MATFPALLPGSRTFTPGTYASATFRSLSGREKRVRLSNGLSGQAVAVLFPLLTETQASSIINHHRAQQSGHLAFALPDDFWSAAETPADFTPDGYQWAYLSKPTVEEITVDNGASPAVLFNVTIELEAVPIIARVAPGATFKVAAAWLPGAGINNSAGATWDVAVDWLAGSAGSQSGASQPPYSPTASAPGGAVYNGSGDSRLNNLFTSGNNAKAILRAGPDKGIIFAQGNKPYATATLAIRMALDSDFGYLVVNGVTTGVGPLTGSSGGWGGTPVLYSYTMPSPAYITSISTTLPISGGADAIGAYDIYCDGVEITDA